MDWGEGGVQSRVAILQSGILSDVILRKRDSFNPGFAEPLRALRLPFHLCPECVGESDRLSNERGSWFSFEVVIDIRGKVLCAVVVRESRKRVPYKSRDNAATLHLL
jgi:hypothetical protein